MSNTSDFNNNISIFSCGADGFDFQINDDNSGLKGCNELLSTIMIALFTDRRANDDDLIISSQTCRRGWWGDTDQEYIIGSRLWLLQDVQTTNEALLLAQQYTEEALQFLIDKGVIGSIEVTTSYEGQGAMCIDIAVNEISGDQQQFLFNGQRQADYSWVWCELKG